MRTRRLAPFRAACRLLALLCVALACAGGLAGADPAPLPAPLHAALVVADPDGSATSLYVRELGAVQPLVELAADTPRHPASVIKLLTAFAALERLGPAYMWSTDVLLGGPLRDGRLAGDLILRGRGDPLLTEERVWLLLRALRERGLRDIDGDLVIDNGWFDLPAEDPGAFDGRPERVYNVVPAATQFNFQATGVTLLPGTNGRIGVSLRPPLAGLTIDNRLRAVPGACRDAQRLPALAVEGQRLRIEGDYATSCGETTLNRVLMRGREHTGAVFAALWDELGGHLRGGVREGRTPAAAPLFYRHVSPPLAEMLGGMNKYSNNVIARMLLLTLGAETAGAPGTPAKGREAVLAALHEHGVPVDGLVLDNGAGLSREARASARTLGRVLEVAWAQPAMPEFVASLALVGVDGTARRLRDTELAGQAHLKTGSVDDVRAIAGYVQARSGRRFVLVCLQNRAGLDPAVARGVQETLLRWVYEH